MMDVHVQMCLDAACGVAHWYPIRCAFDISSAISLCFRLLPGQKLKSRSRVTEPGVVTL